MLSICLLFKLKVTDVSAQTAAQLILVGDNNPYLITRFLSAFSRVYQVKGFLDEDICWTNKQ